jgi:hypothetical protein
MAKTPSDDRGRDFSANRSMDEPVPGRTGRTMNRRAKDEIETGRLPTRLTSEPRAAARVLQKYCRRIARSGVPLERAIVCLCDANPALTPDVGH